MSQAKDDLLNLLNPFFEKKGFRLIKTKTTFIKENKGIEYSVFFKFDGRFGLTMVDWIDTSCIVIAKISKKLIGYTFPIWRKIIRYHTDHASNEIQIPMMYSKSALDLSNEMNLKKLAQLPYDEKYPPHRIENCARVIIKLLNETFFEKIQDDFELFHHYEDLMHELENPMYNGINGANNFYLNNEEKELCEPSFIYLTLLLQKMKIPKSDKIREIEKRLSDDTKDKIKQVHGKDTYFLST